MQWTGIRDASLYLQTDRPDYVTVRWVPAWQADANAEHLYLLDGQGRLVGKRLIKATQERGEQQWPLLPGPPAIDWKFPATVSAATASSTMPVPGQCSPRPRCISALKPMTAMSCISRSPR